jgi:polyhydroxyalkanoate synthesis regulator phasin
MRKHLAWLVRGGDQTRAELAGQAAAIQALQRQVADLGAVVDRIAPAAAVPEQLRQVTDDLGERVATATTRFDVIEARLDHLDETIAELVRVIAPAGDD